MQCNELKDFKQGKSLFLKFLSFSLLSSLDQSEIMMGGKSLIQMFNICEDSLLATPLILDLVLLSELFTRVTFTESSSSSSGDGNNSTTTTGSEEEQSLYSVLYLLSYMLSKEKGNLAIR